MSRIMSAIDDDPIVRKLGDLNVHLMTEIDRNLPAERFLTAVRAAVAMVDEIRQLQMREVIDRELMTPPAQDPSRASWNRPHVSDRDRLVAGGIDLGLQDAEVA